MKIRPREGPNFWSLQSSLWLQTPGAGAIVETTEGHGMSPQPVGLGLFNLQKTEGRNKMLCKYIKGLPRREAGDTDSSEGI